ncbi:hypothetical protein NLJ89_g3185 [Agrocybe chaxingu]|uniref:Uncharacterized protein n=1 Tax=Agrocybe chaxingu TaxID=84603 RepID=A0A9W8K620_9AGAR|nr:hypothetical protein NLJ89_g3185 [Agrocybe chaxingu]
MSDLPLKVRADIRDQWDSPKAAIHSTIDSLAQTLGHKVVPQVQWALLYNALKETFPDKTTFVPTISRIVIALYERLLSRIENEAHTQWTDELLEVLAKKPPGSEWPLQVEPCGANSSARRPRVTWKVDIGAFYLEVPNHEPPMHAIIDSGFDQDLDALFLAPGSTAAASLDDDDREEWAEVTTVETRTALPMGRVLPPNPPVSVSMGPIVQRLPTIETLARPTELFKVTPPYTLIVDASTSPLTVQGSHQPSIELLANYLKKWAKIDSNDSLKRPVLKVSLVESPFYFGVVDSISIEPTWTLSRNKEPINPSVVLAFIEGVLGYKETYTNGMRWVFKRDSILK